MDEDGNIFRAFSIRVTEPELTRINVDKSKTVILQLEALAVLVGLNFCAWTLVTMR